MNAKFVPVLVRPSHWQLARTLYRLYNKRAFGVLDKHLDMPEGSIIKLTDGINCTTCGAKPEEPCLTVTGKRASRPHKDRIVSLLAVIAAIQEEAVIKEEPDYEDVLTDA